MTTANRAERDLLLVLCRNLSTWLHLFNNGQSIQKRYIFSVVEKRIPSNFTLKNQTSPWTKFNITLREGKVNDKLEDSDSSSGGNYNWVVRKNAYVYELMILFNLASASEDDSNSQDSMLNDEYNEQSNSLAKSNASEGSRLTKFLLNNHDSRNQTKSNNVDIEETNMSPSDHLSQLFLMIGYVCQEQFSLIRIIFPSDQSHRIYRLLIQRIFHDPAFGLQYRLESVLNPLFQLSFFSSNSANANASNGIVYAEDYLQSLVLVKEKLASLNFLIQQACLNPTSNESSEEYWDQMNPGDTQSFNDKDEDFKEFVDDQVCVVFEMIPSSIVYY